MSEAPPIFFAWDGECMTPAGDYWARKCDEHYVVGEKYRLIEQHERSIQSHRHYFACIKEAWENLPDRLAEQLPTPEHLRKHALIRAGYRNQWTVAAASPTEARRLLVLVRQFDEYAIVTLSKNIATVYTAQSQSMKAMGKQKFQESKEAVLGIIAGLIETTPETLKRNAGQAA